MSLPWFRMYSEFAADPVVQSLAFEDQRHYVVLLCLKCNGTLDRPMQPKVRDRIVCRGLGLDSATADEAKRRLMEVELIDKNWQPKGWDKRQFKNDVSTERVRNYRKRKETRNVTETDEASFGNAPDTEQIQNRAEEEIEASGETMSGKPDDAKLILQFLNEKAGRNFRPSDVNLKLIKARLKEGYTATECRQVIVRKCRQWEQDDKMREYLRPATLFNREKFNQYAGELVDAE